VLAATGLNPVPPQTDSGLASLKLLTITSRQMLHTLFPNIQQIPEYAVRNMALVTHKRMQHGERVDASPISTTDFRILRAAATTSEASRGKLGLLEKKAVLPQRR
jgi:hypothetical protein